MNVEGKEYKSVWFEQGVVKFIDQRKLPYKFEIYTAETVDDVAFAIKDMVVRGAPAIGVAAAYGMALKTRDLEKTTEKLQQTRPTAHDLFYAIEHMIREINNGEDPVKAACQYAEDIIDRCRRIGEHGEKLIKDDMKILTHCNAGALATVDYGTALAPIKLAHRKGRKIFIYVDETRPKLQGLLTSWELMQEGIKHAVIADNAAGYFMRKKEIDMVITGADRIARNGDFVNKIGTYEKGVLAKDNNIPFYVAAPASTFDGTIGSGDQIDIEERNRNELSEINGKKIMPSWMKVKNPAFDVTPAKYVTGYITEKGIKKTKK